MDDFRRYQIAEEMAIKEEEMRLEALECGYQEVCDYLVTQLEKHPKITARELADSAREWFFN